MASTVPATQAVAGNVRHKFNSPVCTPAFKTKMMFVSACEWKFECVCRKMFACPRLYFKCLSTCPKPESLQIWRSQKQIQIREEKRFPLQVLQIPLSMSLPLHAFHTFPPLYAGSKSIPASSLAMYTCNLTSTHSPSSALPPLRKESKVSR